MEMNTWITKDETSQMTTGLPACNNGMYNNYMDQQQPQQQYSNVRALLQQQNNSFYVPEQYGHELDDLDLCLDDFMVPTMVNNSCAVEYANSIEKKVQQEKILPALLATEPMMNPLNVKTEIMDQCAGDWTQGQTYVCQSPADSGVSVDHSLSPVSDHGSASPFMADSESPNSVPSSYSPESGILMASNGQQSEVGFEIYHDLIMRHLVQDIKATCDRLNICQDPKLWTPSDCRAWLADMAAQYHLTQVPYEKFNVNGSTLCGMSLAQFNQCFPNGGDTVHAQLQIWNSANEYCKRQSSNPAPIATAASMMLPGCLGNQFLPAGGQVMEQQSYKSVEDDLNGYMASQFATCLQTQPQNNQFSQMMGQNGAYNLSTLLPSPGSCSDSGLSADLESNGDQSPNNGAQANNNIHLWQFLRELLDQHEKYGHCVRWVDQSAGIFKIEDSHKLARLWGQRKNRPAMNYDKLSRSLRQYYKKNILKKTTRSQRLVYQFLHPYHMC